MNIFEQYDCVFKAINCLILLTTEPNDITSLAEYLQLKHQAIDYGNSIFEELPKLEELQDSSYDEKNKKIKDLEQLSQLYKKEKLRALFECCALAHELVKCYDDLLLTKKQANIAAIKQRYKLSFNILSGYMSLDESINPCFIKPSIRLSPNSETALQLKAVFDSLNLDRDETMRSSLTANKKF